MTTSRRASWSSSIKVVEVAAVLRFCCAVLIPAKLEQKTAVAQAACCSAPIITVYRPRWYPGRNQGSQGWQTKPSRGQAGKEREGGTQPPACAFPD